MAQSQYSIAPDRVQNSWEHADLKLAQAEKKVNYMITNDILAKYNKVTS